MRKTRGYTVAVHVICWLIFLSLPAVFVAGHSANSNFLNSLKSVAWLYFASYICIFYLHTYFLFPKLYFFKRYFLYVLSIFILATAVFFLRPFDRLIHIERKKAHRTAYNNKLIPNNTLPAGINKLYRDSSRNKLYEEREHIDHERTERGLMGPRLDIVSIVLFILIIALSTTIIVIKRWRIAVEQAVRAETDKAIAELAILKAQVNPHFLFNTLNNIYALAVTHSEKTAESIMKLSNIMRYVTDDANENFVSLVSETNFISDYIELQRLRLGSKVTLDFSVNGNLNDKVIAPLVLITFIENVFKYGISNSEASGITIDLRTYKDSIGFFCRNKLFPFKHQLESTGIGIKNTRKRLEHLYPGKHSLTIKEEDGFYSVHLILQS
ncbi:MAG: histidine kinase [Ferruginibacter sp.]